ncbi:hypothetical protein BJ138DRAFT_1145272 [Hygrophoropsis aurantiaca]|uniref:Uncharacterized protein n=1 Tax=Hygrophoropsis aurantiaca TaxID=72124 RepID=A0ACB8AKQ9_9AGAM|nr:hypothetical protein BJ138DRAFT_1145272 [Hygrophoropsis aurantiaca]
MLQHKQFAAWITTDDTKLEPYGIEHFPDTNTVTCWIVSEAGKKFCVNWQDCSPSRLSDLAGYVSLDGRECGGDTLPRARPSIVVRKGHVWTSPTSRRDFIFSDIQLTDDDTYLGHSNPDLGEVKLCLWYGTKAEIVPYGGLQVPDARKVHERTKKAGTHCVGFGEAVTTQPVNFTRFVPSSSQPIATFIFKYRGHDLLRANGIIPPPHDSTTASSAKSLSEDADESDGDSSPVEFEEVGEDTEREINSLKRKLKLLESKRKDSKGDRASNSRDRPAKKVKVKKEHSRKVFVPSGEVIDLT